MRVSLSSQKYVPGGRWGTSEGGIMGREVCGL